ncbi:MAG: sigma-54-dependent Fis family transcriptional regulator [Calditrichaeota bacterium]|nr:sigma-54-dependent Fis family transcriptional regulator [Calditrichota bacterium]MCB0303062.1 sigma-54-dependent Fis family transcriptional regulator [Calditrichota bacterium]
MKHALIHIVDDEKNIRRSFEIILRSTSYRVRSFESGESFLEALEDETPEVVFLDVLLPGINGIETLKQLKTIAPRTDVVMISGHANLSTAVEATRAGAYDFLEKPLQKEKILLTLQRLLERRSLESRYSTLQATLEEQYRIIGESPQIREVLRKIEKVAPTDSKVLITGESGVGKELVAYAIHQHSLRATAPFIKMNCAAIPEDLIESELFGNEKGAFTGAGEKREGKFMQAHTGTLFLDEVGDMSLRVQTKVLRVLQDGEFQRVGGKETLKTDVRVIAATNKNLAAMVQEGSFREDLYFRLNVLPVEVPPLRERQEDIVLLTRHFLQRYCQRNNRRVPELQEGVYPVLQNYAWPGNIRELQNLVERLVILAENQRITVQDLPGHLYQSDFPARQITPGSQTLAEVREAAERAYIEHCLESAGGNVSQAARLLGVERTNLHKKMKALGIA